MSLSSFLHPTHTPQEELETLFNMALSQDLGDALKILLLYMYVEKVSAEVIEVSGERKLKKLLCRMSSKKRISRALAILRREGSLSEDEYRELRRIFRVLRCTRNSFLHRACGEECPAINLDDVVNGVQLYTSKAREYISRMLISWSTV